MANSRTERIGTIFSRVTALWQTKAIATENLPLWYDVYKTFPPKYEPRFDRPAPETPLKNIFYEEDLIRAKFQKDVKLRMMDLKSDRMSRTQLFCNICVSLQKLGFKEEDIYGNAMNIYTMAFEKSVKTQDKDKSSDNNATKI